jgi:hypothetical protein
MAGQVFVLGRYLQLWGTLVGDVHWKKTYGWHVQRWSEHSQVHCNGFAEHVMEIVDSPMPFEEDDDDDETNNEQVDRHFNAGSKVEDYLVRVLQFGVRVVHCNITSWAVARKWCRQQIEGN